jgi:hypothetical protein
MVFVPRRLDGLIKLFLEHIPKLQLYISQPALREKVWASLV